MPPLARRPDAGRQRLELRAGAVRPRACRRRRGALVRRHPGHTRPGRGHGRRRRDLEGAPGHGRRVRSTASSTRSPARACSTSARAGRRLPEVTLVLAPPDADEAFDTVDRVVRKLALQSGEEVRTRTESGSAINELTVEGFTVAYAKLDDGMVIVTTGPGGIADFLGDGPMLVDDRRLRGSGRARRARRADARLRIRRHRRTHPARREHRRPGGSRRQIRELCLQTLDSVHPPGQRRRPDDAARRLRPRHALSIARTGNAPTPTHRLV